MLRTLLLSLVLVATSIFPARAADLVVLCYHDVQQSLNDPEGMAVTQDSLVAQFVWLREQGFVPVSIDDLLAARQGRPLPEKPVLLTFDDGYASFYTRVFPLLKAFNYPAVVALVGSWLEAGAGEMVAYGDVLVPRERFLSWEQIRELDGSGLVEIASHSYALHQGVLANPQGNRQPAMTARRYDPVSGRYEGEDAYLGRLRSDLTRNLVLLRQQLGKTPRVMVWPYGEYSRHALEIAQKSGMPITLSLEEKANPLNDLSVLGRFLIQGNPSLADFAWQMRQIDAPRPVPRRVMHVDLDYVYDPDPAQQEKNLGLLLDRVKAMGVNTVYLQAFADPDGDGVAQALYFPNRHLPVRADLFNRAAWQLRSRTGVQVYAWMPVLAFAAGAPEDLVQAWRPEGGSAPAPQAYRRLSPFSARARQLIAEIYEDLASHAAFAGLLFHDDAFLSDYEDASPAALAAYRAAGLPDAVGRLRADPALLQRWTRFKSEALTRFTEELAEVVRALRPQIKTARNLYARPVLKPDSEVWFAQSLADFLTHYDYVALMAMPYMEGVADADAWLEDLAGQVLAAPGGAQKVVFELQSVNWRKGNAPIPASTLVRQMRLLQLRGARHYGYYPDNFLDNRPPLDSLLGEMSTRSYPFRR